MQQVRNYFCVSKPFRCLSKRTDPRADPLHFSRTTEKRCTADNFLEDLSGNFGGLLKALLACGIRCKNLLKKR
jgi:hypothetical protein